MKPMLAGPYDAALVRYPVIVQPKLDGIRCIVSNGTGYSRNLKEIPNFEIQLWIRRFSEFHGLDGELMVGDPTAPNAYRVTDSGVMSRHGSPDFRYVVFDIFTTGHFVQRGDLPYVERRASLEHILRGNPDARIQLVDQQIANNEEELLQIEAGYVALGYEGVILRDPDGTYKHGRSTGREGKLIKLKRFLDAEAVIVGFEELYSNQNEATINALGKTERSSHRANMVPKNTLGALIVQNVIGKQEFRIGSFKGLDLQARKEIWDNREKYLGKRLTYKFQEVGGYDLPRFPIFKGWRSDV